ncbi:Zinc finger, C4 type (two domains) [Popillia japonica]|uniref:Zinc finger, C4 type (Two domains) n=1 Tax=Popillia japonica TaxID=7064 RepID=A0AAW1MPF9_POPJA
MDNKTDSKICGVCGDKALGYNFGAVTCESCKAFFRRNALSQKDFRCPFNQQCDITTVTRRFCQKCRLEKCFTIGMRKDCIMSEKDKVLKRQKIEENRAKRRAHNGFKQGFKKIKRETSIDDDSHDCDTSDYGELYSPVDQNTNTKDQQNIVSVINYNNIELNNSEQISQTQLDNVTQLNISDILNDGNSAVEESMIRTMLTPTPNGSVVNGEESDRPTFSNNNDLKCNNNSNTDYVNISNDAKQTAKVVLEEVRSTPVEANSIESILCEAIKLEFEAYSSIASYKALLTPVDDDISSLIGDDGRFKGKPDAILANPALVDVINLTAVAIRRLIKMAKKINAFKNMCQEDQVALLKGGCTEMLMLRSLMNYDESKQIWSIPHRKEYLSSLKADVLKLAKGNFYQEHERFIQTFDPKWRTDENIVLILCAIALFTPDRPRVIHQDVIKLEQNSYYYLLRRYLESTFPGCEAKSTFLKLIQKISELHKLNEENFIKQFILVGVLQIHHH